MLFNTAERDIKIVRPWIRFPNSLQTPNLRLERSALFCYAKPSNALISEADWVALVRAVAAGDQLALHALYERAHRPVFTFVLRMTANRETAA